MYLFHVTSYDYIKKILQDNELKSSKLTGNLYLGDGIYTSSKYVFLGTTKKLFDNNVLGHVIIYLKSDLLYNRMYFIENQHSSSVIYGKKINRYNKDYNNILEKLYNKSIEIYSKVFQAFQQVALLNKIPLENNIAGIYIRNNDKLKKYLTKKYPNIIIK